MAVTQKKIRDVADAAQGAAFATGTIEFTDNVANNNTITINGTEVVFKTSGATGNQVNIAGNGDATAAALLAFLSASTNANIKKATYALDESDPSIIVITHKIAGAAGNSYSLAKSAANITISGANLTGGSDAGATDFATTDIGGLVEEENIDTDYEKNLMAIVAAVDFALKNGANPASNYHLCRQQRKLIKNLLADLSASLSPVAAVTDDRTTYAQTVRTKVLKKYNNIANVVDNS